MSEVDRLKEELQLKDAELRELQASYDDFLESSKDLERELERDLEQAEEKNAELSHKKEVLEQRLDELQHRFNEASRDLLQTQDELEKVKHKYRTLETEKRVLEQQNEEAATLVRISQASEEDLRYKLEKAIEETVFLQADLEDLKKRRQAEESRLRAEIEALQARLAAAASGGSGDGNGRVDAAGASPTSHGTEHDAELIEALEGELEELTLRLAEAEEKNQELNEELSHMEEELVAARKISAQGGLGNEELVAQLQDSEARALELEQELASVSDQLIAKDQEVVEARHRLEELANLRENATVLEARINERTEEVKTLKVQLADTQAEVKARESFIKELEVRIQKLEAQVEQVEQEKALIQHDFVSLQRRIVARKERRRRSRVYSGDSSNAPSLRESVAAALDELDADAFSEGLLSPPAAGHKTMDPAPEEEEEEESDSEPEGWKAEKRALLEQIASLSAELELRMKSRDPNAAMAISPRVPSFDDITGGNVSARSVAKVVEDAIICQDVHKLASMVQGLAARYESQRAQNSQLLTKLQATQGNIQVCCRIRPATEAEIASKAQVAVEALSETEVAYYDSRQKSWKSFAFDRVWSPDQTQQDVFADIEPLALSVVDGYNACIMAYGQTGSGKTYTMIGYKDIGQYGVAYRTLHKIFDLLSYRQSTAEEELKRLRSASLEGRPSLELRTAGQDAKEVVIPAAGGSPGEDDEDSAFGGQEAKDEEEGEEARPFEYNIRVSMLEIYNEQVRDLLDPTNTHLEIRHTQDGHVHVPGLAQQTVSSIDDVMSVMERGSSNRAIAATNIHQHSSRSHSVLIVDVDTSTNSGPPVTGRLYLVDLAGSERVGKSMVTGAELKEAQAINYSLAALGDVMEALDNKAKHVPYRNSKLTHLLQDSLGGNSRTLMVVTVCPTIMTAEESHFTLQFATRVRRIQLAVATRNVNNKNIEETLKAVRAELKLAQKAKVKLSQELASLKREHRRNQEKMVTQLDVRARSQDEVRKNYDQQLEALRTQNLELSQKFYDEKRNRERLQSELEASQRAQMRQQSQLKDLQRDKETLTEKLKEREKESTQLRQQRRQSLVATPSVAVPAGTRAVPRSRPSGIRPPVRSPTRSNVLADANDDNRSDTGSTHTTVQTSSRPSSPGSSTDAPAGRPGDRLSMGKSTRSNSFRKLSTSSATSATSDRAQMALQKHKERLLKKKAEGK